MKGLSIAVSISIVMLLGLMTPVGAEEVNTAIKDFSGYEWCKEVKKGHKMTYSFKTDGPVDFNLHYHVKRDTFYPVKKGNVTEAEGVYNSEVSNLYCLMWTTGGSAVNLSLTAEVTKK